MSRAPLSAGFLLPIFIATCLFACTAENGDRGGGAASSEIRGGLQKGPFLLGSSVTASPVDDSANPTGQVFNTKTDSDLGDFSLSIPYEGFLALEGTGFYYNEATGDLSGASIVLRAYASVAGSGPQDVYLNIITHLTYDRIEVLLASVDFPAAVNQAEQELREAIAVGPPEGLSISRPAVQMNLLGGNDLDNAYLFAVSAVLAVAGGTDAGLQELANTISSDLADDGAVSDATVNELHEAQAALDVPAITASLAARLASLGSSAEVPDLNLVLDQDFDGLVNAVDNCPHDANADQADADGNGFGDVCDCGNGRIDRDEQCDDGNAVEGDGCDNDCTYGECGDGFVDPNEQCDDGNAMEGDGCDNDCTYGECGDGFVDPNDSCDDGNQINGDGCDNDCTFSAWIDVAAGLMWQVIPSFGFEYGHLAAGIEHCNNLALLGYDDWRLPTISELRSLVRGCPPVETGGACAVTDDCLTEGGCFNVELCCPSSCHYEGPGAGGAYGPPAFPLEAWGGLSPSLSAVPDFEYAESWSISFGNACLSPYSGNGWGWAARCVRDASSR